MTTIQHMGRSFEVNLEAEDYCDPPWMRDDFHVVLERVPHDYGSEHGRSKQPAEVIVYRGDRRQYSYSVHYPGAIAQALADNWGASDNLIQSFAQKHGRTPTKREIAVMAVDADIARMRAWLSNEWWYEGVCVQLIGLDGEPEGDKYDHAVWRVESDGEYWREVAIELAENILREKGKAWRAALREARETRYWARRDVETIGA